MHPRIRTGIVVALAIVAGVLLVSANHLGAGSADPAPGTQAGSEQGLPEFQPSEKLPVDAAVAFPTDI
jgi:hypothetical protein